MKKHFLCGTVCFLLMIFSVCSVFKVAAECDHNFTLLTHIEPTCTAKGEDLYICSCGAVYTETISAIGHKFSLISEKKATYTSEGSKIYSCSVCGDSYSETTPVLTLSPIESVKIVSYSAKKVKIKWSSVKGATEYEISYKKQNGEWEIAATKNLTYTCENLNSASLYHFRVRAICGENAGQWSETLSQYTKPTTVSIKEAKADTDTSNIFWTKSKGSTGYQIYYGTDKNFNTCKKSEVAGDDTLNKTLTSLSSSTVYYIKIRPFLTSESKKIYGDFSSVTEFVTLPTISGIKSISATESGATVKWKEVKNATGYYLEYSASKSFASCKKIKISALSYSIENLDSCQTYYFRVRAYKKYDGVNYYGDYSDISSVTVKPATVKITKITRDCKKVTLKWKKANNVSGYEIKYSAKEDFSSAEKLSVTGASVSEKVITPLKSATSYYVKIRGYKIINGEKLYGKYSPAKRITTTPSKTETESINAGEGKFTVKWKKVDRADFYQIVYSTSENFKNSTTVTVKQSETFKKTLKNLSIGKVYYVKIRACKKVGSAKIYGQYSDVLKIRTQVGTVKMKKAVANINSISLSWNKVSSSNGYEILYGTYSSFSDGKTVKIKGGRTLEAVLKNLESAKSYYIKVRAYKNVDGKTVYGNYCEKQKITTLPQKVNISKIEKKNSATLKIHWTSLSNVSGYELLYSQSSNFENSVKISVSGQATTSRVVKELTSGTYYFKVRAYKTVDGKRVYGSYSSVKQFSKR